MYPLDTVKKRLQTAHMARADYFGRHPVPYKGMWDALVRIAQEEQQIVFGGGGAGNAGAAVAARSGASGGSVAGGGATASSSSAGAVSSGSLLADLRLGPDGRPLPLYRRMLRRFPRAWFKGLSPSLLKAAGGAALTFWSYESGARLLRRQAWACDGAQTSGMRSGAAGEVVSDDV
jgi:hypothetical protein